MKKKKESLQLRSSAQNLLGNTVLVLLEVLDELRSQSLSRAFVALGISHPGLAGIQDLIRNTVASLGNGQVEDREVLELGALEAAVVDGVQDRSGVAERASLATGGGGGTDPTGVDEPGVGIVFGDLVSEHLGVAHRVESKERLSEASGESGLRFRDTFLGTAHLGSVAGDEVVGDGAGVELGDRWEDTGGVAGEEDEVFRVAVGDAREFDVGNVFEWVGGTGVLGESGVVVVDFTGVLVEDDVLENGTVADGTVDFRLLFAAEADALCVAASLDVEDTGVGPAVLVVTDQGTFRVSGEGSLAGTGKSEEDGDVTVLTLVGGGVESEDVVLDWHFVEHDGEDTLLHLTGVLGAEDDHFLLGEVESDGCRRSHTGGVFVGWEAAGIVDDPVGVEVLEFFSARADEHVSHEESVVSASADDTDVDPVASIPAGITVDDVDAVASVKVVDGTFAVDNPGVVVHGLVDGAPPDFIFRRWLLDDSLVAGRAAGLLTGVSAQGTRGGDGSAALEDEGIFVEGGDGRVGDDLNSVVVNVGLVVKFLLDLSVLRDGSNTLWV